MAIDILKIGTATNKQDIEAKLPGMVFTIKNDSISTQLGKPAENSNSPLDNTFYTLLTIYLLVLGRYIFFQDYMFI